MGTSGRLERPSSPAARTRRSTRRRSRSRGRRSAPRRTSIRWASCSTSSSPARVLQIRSSSSGALEAAILESDPPPPSASAPSAAERKALRGDLDTIVLKSLKKNPAERYATVHALGDDLLRWLDGRPVLARPDSVRYRLSKFVRRNAVAVAAAAVVVVSLAAFGIESARQARVLAGERRLVQIERDTAEQVVRVLIDLFEATNPAVRPDGDRMPVGEFVTASQARTLERLRSTPAARARLQQVFGLIQQTRGRYAEARQALDAAIAEQRRLLGADHPETLESQQALAELAASLGETERARTLLEESLRRHTRVFGEGHERTARVLQALAPVVATTDLDAGGRLLLRAVEIHRARLPPDDPVRATALGSLAGYYTQRAEYDRAKRHIPAGACRVSDAAGAPAPERDHDPQRLCDAPRHA